MRKGLILTAALIASVAMTGLFAAAENVIDDSKTPEYLFILTADTGTFKDGKLTLNGTPIVAFYALGEKRDDGHFFSEQFVKMWDTKAVILKADPPNGTINILDDKGSYSAVMEFSEPKADINTITFKARVLEGDIPASFNSTSMFLRLKLTSPIHTQN